VKNFFGFFKGRPKKEDERKDDQNAPQEQLVNQKDDALDPEVPSRKEDPLHEPDETLHKEEKLVDDTIEREKELLDTLGVDYAAAQGQKPQDPAPQELGGAADEFSAPAEDSQKEITNLFSEYKDFSAGETKKDSKKEPRPQKPHFISEKNESLSLRPKVYANPASSQKASRLPAAAMIIVLVIAGALGYAFFASKKAKDTTALLNESNLVKAELQKQIGALKIELKTAQDEKDSLNEKLIGFMSQVQDSKESSKTLETKINTLNTRLTKAKESQEILQDRYNKLLEEAKKLRTKQQELVEESKKPLKETIKERNLKITALRDEIKGLRQNLTLQKGLYYYNLGVAYTQAKMYAEAIGAYEKALELNPSVAEAHYNLGLLYEEVEKDYARASRHYRDYLALKPQAEDTMQVKKALDALHEKGY
jgi:tetratricopeptide (TPR) repeat protein